VSQSIDTGPRATIRTIVASFLFTDLVGFSKGTAAEQYSAKAQLTTLLRRDLAMLRESDYWIKDTGDGALIGFVSNPEHALYVALALGHDYGDSSSGDGAASNSLRTGLHLGTVKESIDLEGRRNFVGDGINAAKRIMDFAGPGQITASRSYFEAIANLDSAYAALFKHLGAPDDKHGRTHELYAVSRSDAVLEKLKADLAAEAGESSATETSGAKAGASEAPTAATTRTARPVSMMTIALLVLFGAASVYYFTSQREPAAPAARTTPEPTKPPPESAKPALESTKAATESATPASMANQQPPSTSGQDSVAAPSSISVGAGFAGGPSPSAPAPPSASPSAVTKPASTTSPVAAARQRPAALPPATTPSGSTSDASSPRCSRIVEKAAVGEQLTQEEKRELATCR